LFPAIGHFFLAFFPQLRYRDYNSLKEEGFMYIPRLLLLSLLISLCGATAAAQSSPSDNSGNERTVQRENDSVVIQPLDSRMPHILTLQQDEKTCYTIRTYRVARESPDSDSTRPAGYSTCQRATRFQLKEAVDSRDIAPR
jgi:hypothetical protein